MDNFERGNIIKQRLLSMITKIEKIIVELTPQIDKLKYMVSVLEINSVDQWEELTEYLDQLGHVEWVPAKENQQALVNATTQPTANDSEIDH